MFSVESLALAGETYENSEHVKKACEFVLGKQMEDGGWGESYKVRFYVLRNPLIAMKLIREIYHRTVM